MLTLDQLIVQFDKGLRTLLAPAHSIRDYPDEQVEDALLTDEEKRQAAALMRVNHVGEVCAQALYQGQALTARDPETRKALEHAAWEETEHLAWTERRIADLGGRKSLLNPVWYTGSLTIGVLAGLIGDKWNLGFLAETERQVCKHLDSHLSKLPVTDAKSRAILVQMRDDEAQHAATAVQYGAADLPLPVRGLMKLSSKVMTGTAYWV
ncbi:2-polyprenyl-3-methyl-6-methoxy-1,4-benzoquinone monooxygenase [Chitinivorax sp. B]|uniref:2-polyprenyl-3-methyl-6-methoxy-1,4-benzoquinone monooxygenase n=1 Tax=Chitinivorax sp. B TaxID=2502235 RepID=UPI0010F80F34|nr:2-polyprenyl-3-methyl-6-methoxy-1,4-benzoquinone monooxygenase [Chitinivorax sp. B]